MNTEDDKKVIYIWLFIGICSGLSIVSLFMFKDTDTKLNYCIAELNLSESTIKTLNTSIETANNETYKCMVSLNSTYIILMDACTRNETFGIVTQNKVCYLHQAKRTIDHIQREVRKWL